MRTIAKKTFVMLLVIVFVTSVFASTSFAQAVMQEEEISTENMIADAVLVRPLGLCAVVLGVGLFIISLPFSALGKNVKEAGQKLVVAPAKFTFQRPLGAF
jgi:protein-S-isoprenylcysteine O-methyltransferase Ste14